jgi:hypothetical protein
MVNLPILTFTQYAPSQDNGDKYTENEKKGQGAPAKQQQFRFQTGKTFIIRARFKNPASPKLFPPFSRFFPVRLKQNGNSIA